MTLFRLVMIIYFLFLIRLYVQLLSYLGPSGYLAFYFIWMIGKAKLEGDSSILEQLGGMMFHFDIGFEVLPGTGAQDLSPDRNPFQQEPPASTAGG